MKIVLTSVFVDDQDQALEIYVKKLGFVPRQDERMGAFRFLTVAEPDRPDGPELLLEPNDNPAARTYQRAMFEQGIPVASFGVASVTMTYQRLKDTGLQFTMPPTELGPVTMAVFDDTCGNLIQIAERHA
jgi:catechol 2,3-dioxygenase-like lactoylglutathione lyase family enzyme